MALPAEGFRRFVLARQFLGFDFACFHVRLVECIDADDGAGDGRGNLQRKNS